MDRSTHLELDFEKNFAGPTPRLNYTERSEHSDQSRELEKKDKWLKKIRLVLRFIP